MYQIFYGDLPLYDPRDPELVVRDPSCHLAVGESGALSFIVDSDHPFYDRIAHLGRVSLVADGLTIYRGRVRRVVRDFNLSVLVETEGLLSCLNDSVIPPFLYPADWIDSDDAAYAEAANSGNVIEFFLRWIIDQHNSQVGAAQRIALGTVTVSDPNNYLYRASERRATAMETLKGKLLDGLGGYLVMDYGPETPVLNYYADLPLTNVQPVEYGGNLLDLTTETDAAETCTAILPEGADGLTIADLPDGVLTPGYVKQGLLIYSEAAEEALGGQRITRIESWPDVTVAANLSTKALTKLSTEGVKVARTIKVQAIDLGGAEDVARFVVGRYVQLISRPHGYNIAYPLTELSPDIFNPGNTEITLGASVLTASDLAVDDQHKIEETLDRHQIDMNQQKDAITEAAVTTQEQITAAIQTAESIIFSALESYVQTSNYEQFKSTVESQLTILADEISLRFTETTTHVNNVNGDLQQVVETLAKHFDFGIDGLGIKAGDNAMTLTLDNDLIIFKKNGQQFGWWDGVDFHTGNIIIAVNERAQFGNFAMVPRSNGSTSWLKVGG